jgi:hypothetical protein
MRIPDAVHELVEWEIEVAYQQGYRAALADLAAGSAELDAARQPIGRRRYEQQVAARLAEMRRHAERLRAELDRSAPGGDWPGPGGRGTDGLPQRPPGVMRPRSYAAATAAARSRTPSLP